MELNLFTIFTFYSCDIVKRKNIGGVRYGLSVKGQGVGCLSIMEDKRQKSCMRAKTSVDTCQARSRKEEIMSSLVHFSVNNKIGKRRTTRRL